MNETLTTFLYELANFVVFALLLGWIFVKPIRRMLDEQVAKDAQQEQAAQQRLADAESLRQQLLDDRRKFNQEMEDQRKTILAETRQDAAQLMKQANQTIITRREQLSREVVQIQQQQLTELARVVANASQQAIESLLQRINGPRLEDALLESACQQLQQHQPAHEEELTVETATELEESARQKISSAAGRPVSNGKIDYRIDQDLLGGIRIKSSRGVIDTSIAALCSFAGQSIRNQLNQNENKESG